MSNRGGRPTDLEQKRRRGKFLCLVAQGIDPVEARKRANLNPDIALRVAFESDYRDIVEAIRAGELGPTVVVVDVDDHQVAA